MKTSTRLLPATLLACALGQGCLTVADDTGPTLSVEIFWDDAPGSSFEPSDCYGARVDRMEWTLWEESDAPCSSADQQAGDCMRRGSKGSVVRVVGDEENCLNAIDLELDPGRYELDLTGLDETGKPTWQATCSDLTVLRFDVAYECDVDAR